MHLCFAELWQRNSPGLPMAVLDTFCPKLLGWPLYWILFPRQAASSWELQTLHCQSHSLGKAALTIPQIWAKLSPQWL